MKRRIVFPMLVLLLTLVLSVPLAAPAMAASSIDLSLSVSPPTVCVGDEVELTVTMTNDGTYDFTTIQVDLTGPITQTLGPVSLPIGETVQWTLTTTVTEETDTFYAVAHGFSTGCTEEKFYCAQVTVCVVPCGEGLTPGFWKNHRGEWAATGYSTDDLFSDVFGVGPAVTLIKALKTGGGGAKALGRHAVAALLNAAHPDIDYPYTEAEIIAAVQAAYGSGDYEDTKDDFEFYNEKEADL